MRRLSLAKLKFNSEFTIVHVIVKLHAVALVVGEEERFGGVNYV